MEIRHNWTTDEVHKLLTGPLDELVAHAKEVHRTHAAQDVQQCMLLSVKTGACPEDCGYCSQSAHFKTKIGREPLMELDEVKRSAKVAKDGGATRFCMGAAWRSVPNDRRFDTVLEMIREVASHGMEVCCTLGMANEDQLKKMKEAGLTAYNHNLDTSRDYYPQVITTRTYDDRLNTIRAARSAGVQVCCGGILGLGESVRDRADLLRELACMEPQPESVPINLLVPIEGTPLQQSEPVPFEDFLRMVATARILMPKSRVRLSAGRNTLTEEEQLQCFAVGANSIFVGEKLLTAPNVDWDADQAMYKKIETTAAAPV